MLATSWLLSETKVHQQSVLSPQKTVLQSLFRKRKRDNNFTSDNLPQNGDATPASQETFGRQIWEGSAANYDDWRQLHSVRLRSAQPLSRPDIAGRRRIMLKIEEVNCEDTLLEMARIIRRNALSNEVEYEHGATWKKLMLAESYRPIW